MSPIAGAALAPASVLGAAIDASTLVAGVAAGAAGAAALGDVEAVLEHAARTMASVAIGRIRERFIRLVPSRSELVPFGAAPVGLVNGQSI
jgi:hypothetical protein